MYGWRGYWLNVLFKDISAEQKLAGFVNIRPSLVPLTLFWLQELAENPKQLTNWKLLHFWWQKGLRLRYWPTVSGRPSSARRSGRLAHLPRWRRRRCLLHPRHQRCWSPGLWSPCAATPSLVPCQRQWQFQGEGRDRDYGRSRQRCCQTWKIEYEQSWVSIGKPVKGAQCSNI